MYIIYLAMVMYVYYIYILHTYLIRQNNEQFLLRSIACIVCT